ncbi:hypothetical protein [Aquimarina aggregata]|uniref:hypothetical protein n=1 Tax=Aquimarina aggregata TaxID=1642818 RepID=UPI002493C131|nr:hypothetical protein [Aquimarina aggregata]
MKITKDTPIHYFIKDRSNSDWYNLDLEAYLEIPQGDGKSKFQVIEDIHLFYNTDLKNYESGSFQISLGRDSCHYSGHDTIHKLIEQQQRDVPIYGFKKVSKDEYLALRDKAFKIYLNHRNLDFEKL